MRSEDTNKDVFLLLKKNSRLVYISSIVVYELWTCQNDIFSFVSLQYKNLQATMETIYSTATVCNYASPTECDLTLEPGKAPTNLI